MTEKLKDTLIGISIAVVCLGAGYALGAGNAKHYAGLQRAQLASNYERTIDSLKVTSTRTDSLYRISSNASDSLKQVSISQANTIANLKNELRVWKYWGNEAMTLIKNVTGDESYFVDSMMWGTDNLMTMEDVDYD